VLVELRARELGVIADLTLLLGPGMTAITGETGAGKTLVVEAIDLLVGGRADPGAVRAGAVEAVVEGCFASTLGDTGAEGGQPGERVLRRVVPAKGRSRAQVDGAMATVAELAELGRHLIDLHGQHAHQSLLHPATQRAALDAFGRVELAPLVEARRRLAALDAVLAELGGDERARAREVDLLRHQVAELAAAAITGPGEDLALAEEEDRLGDAEGHREAAAAGHGLLSEDGGALDAVGLTVAALSGRAPLGRIEERLRGLAAELADVAGELRDAAESLESDPARLAAIRERRQLLVDLRRKYGATLEDVLAFGAEAQERLDHLVQLEARAADLDAERAAAAAAVATAEAEVLRQRQAAAPRLGVAVRDRLAELAMPRVLVAIEVGGADGADVTFLLAANPGEPTLPLAKVASGGELARTMLALRLALTGSTRAGEATTRVPTLVFDEVDAGIGGEAALAVGRSLAALSRDHQVLVVTHLAQVAAFADSQVVVEKHEAGGRTVSTAELAEGEGRARELARMLSGQPDAASARAHAEELLRMAAVLRGPQEGAA
jgi:DNA repair protein RecN (Recombination protein N)